jgi:hypothetical protein
MASKPKQCLFAFLVGFVLPSGQAAGPADWVPARWQGGPLELARRAQAKDAPGDAAVRDAIANWYDPATLELLEGAPINCLLATWSAGMDAELEARQQQLVKAYAVEARKRGIAVLGLVYPGSDAVKTARTAADARLDGLVLEGDFPAGGRFAADLRKALASAGSAAAVIPILRDAASGRTAEASPVAVEGVSPSARNLADMGIRAAPSSEPWIESNAWLVRSFRVAPQWRPVWISQAPQRASAADYIRCVADAALAGGRWIVALEDEFRARLRRNEPAAAVAWRRIGAYLRFAESHADWRRFEPFGNLGIVWDPAAADQDGFDEYLKLVARRQTPYRLIPRPQLGGASLTRFRALLATGLAPPTEAERGILRAFAERGGVVIAGPAWGDPPKDEAYAERALGKGRAVVYREPDPETVARDMRELLSQDEMGIVAFNVPSVITYASGADSGAPLLIQLLNYSDAPAESITVRIQGSFRAARLYTPEAGPSDLVLKREEGKTDVTIPKLALWGAVLLE